MTALHVVPLGDLVEHDTDTDDGCVCGPTPRPVWHNDGACDWLMVHHSLDGREARGLQALEGEAT